MAGSLSENAMTVLKERYLWKKMGDNTETPEQMFLRVAKHVAGNDLTLRKAFFRMMSDLEFLPNSPTLMNAGKKSAQLAACFVLPLADDLDSIMNTLKTTALIHQSGGGTGFSFGNLRSQNSEVSSSHGVAAGPIGFLKLFNELTQTIKQGGLRRGANMGILPVSHPDIFEFIRLKNDLSLISNFNLSVSISDTFMKAVENDKPFQLFDPHFKNKKEVVQAKELFRELCLSAHGSGEPGLIFIDEINRKNPTPSLGKIVATNPCGEQPLLPFEACNLGSINLVKVFSSGDGKINWDKLANLTELSVLFLDRAIDTCSYPTPEIHTVCHHNRKIGLGVMGLADLFLLMRVRYGSLKSLKIGEQLMKFIRDQAVRTSQQLAKKKGPFTGFSKSLWKKNGLKPLRNAALTTIAPTGTISLIAGTSAGIEPIFNYEMFRQVLEGKKLSETHPLYELAKTSMTNENFKEVFITTRDVTVEQHVQMQSAFQKFSDSAVSKTINLSEDAKVDEVEKAYLLAWKLKCKGITVYRDKSRPNQVLNQENCPDCAVPVIN